MSRDAGHRGQRVLSRLTGRSFGRCRHRLPSWSAESVPLERTGYPALTGSSDADEGLHNDGMPTPDEPPQRRSIDDLLTEARARLVRLGPEEAHRAQQDGAVLVDIRPQAD